MISVALASTVSSSVPFITCPVQSISLKDSTGATFNAFTTTGSTVTLTPTVLDSKGVTITTLPTLNYSTAQPVVVALSSSTSVASSITATAGAAGESTIVATCTPPNCNTGLYPVYSNIYGTSVSGTTSTTAYVASKSSTSLVPITTSTNAVGTALTLPATPNSMLISPAADKIVLGTDLSTSSEAMVFTL